MPVSKTVVYMAYLELAGGFILLLAGGELLVRGACATARRLGVAPLIVGITLVGFGTSTPELVTSLEAALLGAPGIAVGNVVGSNIANILLILGLAGVIAPLHMAPATMKRDGAVVLLTASGCVLAVMAGHIGRVQGAMFVVALLAYIGWSYLQERRRYAAEGAAPDDSAPVWPRHLGLAVVFTIVGIGITILGAHWLIEGAVAMASQLGVSDAVIGLTIVAVGTSLPELATSVIAALKRQPEIALGNVLGSNIYNILGILGVTALVQPLDVPAVILDRDVWVMLAATVALLLLAWRFQRIGRMSGLAFLGGYAAYTVALFVV
jgi:cation:H+ antiporter